MYKRVFAILCVLTFLAQQGQVAAATFTVSNDTDCNANECGSLRDAINQSNSAGGTNTINFPPGTNGTIALGSAFPIIN
jgi:hypothetical protein